MATTFLNKSILIAGSSEQGILGLISFALKSTSARLRKVSSLEAVLPALETDPAHLLVLELNRPETDIPLLNCIRKMCPALPVLALIDAPGFQHEDLQSLGVAVSAKNPFSLNQFVGAARATCL